MRRITKSSVLLGLIVALTAVVWPGEVSAQGRGHGSGSAVRPAGSARSYAPAYRPYYHRPYYYRPYYYHYRPYYYRPYYHAGFYWGAYGWYPWYPYGFYPPFPYYGYGYAYDPGSDVRVQVTPREAQVYVDGYFVGLVDDFDGWSQRLRLVPGEHEIVIYLEGYRSLHEKNLFRPGTSYKIRGVLERLGPGEAQPEKPTPAPGSEQPPADPAPPGAAPPPYGGPDRDRGERRADAAGFGTLAIRVQPADAVVEIDGERWDSPAGGSRLLVDVSEGTHRIQIRKDGFRPYATDVQVRAGEQTTINVSLPPE